MVRAAWVVMVSALLTGALQATSGTPTARARGPVPVMSATDSSASLAIV